MLDIHGRFATLRLPDEPRTKFNAMSLFGHVAFFGGSHSASKKECLQILQLAVDKSVNP
jgi:alcohol dehydrogenase (NADP+)